MKLHNVDDQLDVSVSKLRGSTFSDVDMTACVFRNVDMADWRISDVSLRNGRIANADMTNFAIEHVKLDGMTINGILVSELMTLYQSKTTSPA